MAINIDFLILMEKVQKHWKPIVIGVGALLGAYLIYKYTACEENGGSSKRKAPF